MYVKRIENNAENILISFKYHLLRKEKKKKESIQQALKIFKEKKLPRIALSDYHNLHKETIKILL